MSADTIGLHSTNRSPETADFRLSPGEISKGEKAASAYLDSLKSDDVRRAAEDALDTLATVISGGVCGGFSFPWHQVRAYHGALALSIVKEAGAPAHVETLRCRHDEARKFQQVPDAFVPKQVQRMRTSLRRVIEESWNLGYISNEEMRRAVPPTKGETAPQPRTRTLSDGEVRALLSACNMDASVTGSRDALMICLAFLHGLRTVDLVNLTLDDLHFDSRSGKVTLRTRQPQGKRIKRIPLENEELIALEDWLEVRGRDDGPLFCSVARGQRIAFKRMTAAAVREFCDQRAAQAGVAPFAPNDLAKSGPYRGDTGRRRSRAKGRNGEPALASVSPLYEAGTGGDGDTASKRIHFPYPIRMRG